MNSDAADSFLDRAEQALWTSNAGRRNSEIFFLQQLMRNLGGQVFAPELCPAGLFRAAVKAWPLVPRSQDLLRIVGFPSKHPEAPLRPGDWMLRAVPGTGDVGHVSVLVSNDLLTLSSLSYEGIAAEGTHPGYYGIVIEAGAFPHTRKESFARRFLDSRGRVPAYTVILRPQLRDSDSSHEFKSSGWPVSVQHPSNRAAEPGSQAEGSWLSSPGIYKYHEDLPELGIATDESDPDPRNTADYIRWIQTSLNQVDSAKLTVNGINEAKTQAAVASFQTGHALVIDSIVGPETEAELIAEGATRPPGYALCAAPALGKIDPTALDISPVGENDYDGGSFTASTGTVFHIRGNVVYPATASGSKQPFNPKLGSRVPILFMAHGNHAAAVDPLDPTKESCGGSGQKTIPNHRGYIYFQGLLARMGIISVSVDCNENCATNFLTSNIHERADLIVASIRHFQSLNSGGDPTFGDRIDFSKVGLFGHSRGAEAVLVVPELAGARAAAGATFVGVLSLAPTDAGASSGAPRGYAFMTILPAADGDVVTNDGAKYYDQATPHPFKTQLYVYDANHNFFNREWVNPDTHSGSGPMVRGDHERILNVYGSAFFREILFAHGFQNLLLGRELPPAARTGKVHISAELEKPVATVDDYENSNVALNTLSQTVVLSGFSTADEFPFKNIASAFNLSFFGNTNGLILRRSSATNRMRSALDKPRDLTNKEIWIRVAEVYNGSVPRGRTGFRIGLEDTGKRISFVDSNAAGGVPRPFDRKADDLLHFGTDLTKTIPETFRFPAKCFAGVSGFDIQKIQAIHLQLNRNDGRALAFDQLQIV